MELGGQKGEYYNYRKHLFGFFCVFRDAPAACGGFQARGRMGAVAADQCHSHSIAGSEPHLQPTPQLMAMMHP